MHQDVGPKAIAQQSGTLKELESAYSYGDHVPPWTDYHAASYIAVLPPA
tara:strand:- start:90 stop:236 length:147 start_codon:yes stop_codon:yes gene_type:complete